MLDFFRKCRLVWELRKLNLKVDRTEVEEQTGVRFGVPRPVFLGAMAEKFLWGWPYKFWGNNWKRKRMAKDKSLLRGMEEENPPIVKCRTVKERDEEALKRFNVSVERPTRKIADINSHEEFQELINESAENNRVTVELTGKGYSYVNPSQAFERFLREFSRIVWLVVLIVIAIWTSPFLLHIRDIILTWLNAHL